MSYAVVLCFGGFSLFLGLVLEMLSKEFLDCLVGFFWGWRGLAAILNRFWLFISLWWLVFGCGRICGSGTTVSCSVFG